jgi:hypothetical protein
MQIRDVTHNVRAEKCVSPSVLINNPLCKLLIKEFRNHADTIAPGNLGNIARRFDPQVPNALCREIAKQDPVVTANLDDKRV